MKKQKSTTQSTKKEKKGKSRRSKTRFPALNKGVNLSSRKDYIEPEYVDGVYDQKGHQVIRPLTYEEKAWLNQFYEETVVTNFYHDPELKKLNKQKKMIVEDEVVKDLLSEISELSEDKEANSKRINQLKQIVRITKKQNEETYADELEEIEEELQKLREKLLLYPDKEDHKEFYNHNNARNNCIFNKKKIMGRLVGLDTEDYDNYTIDKLKNLDLEYVPEEEVDYEEQQERIEAILDEVKEHFKK